MEQIIVKNKKFDIPEKFVEQQEKGLVITQHRVKEVIKGRMINCYFRHPPKLPYIEKECVEFKIFGQKPERYEFKEN